MKKIILIMLLSLLLYPILAQFSVEFKQEVPFWIVFMEFKGSQSQTVDFIPVFVKEVRKQNLKVSGNLVQMFFNNMIEPERGESTWGIGVRIPKDIELEPPLKILKYPCENIAYMVHTGPYDAIGNSFNFLFPYLHEQGFSQDGPVLTIWLDDPENVEPEKLRTEILVPVKK